MRLVILILLLTSCAWAQLVGLGGSRQADGTTLLQLRTDGPPGDYRVTQDRLNGRIRIELPGHAMAPQLQSRHRLNEHPWLERVEIRDEGEGALVQVLVHEDLSVIDVPLQVRKTANALELEFLPPDSQMVSDYIPEEPAQDPGNLFAGAARMLTALAIVIMLFGLFIWVLRKFTRTGAGPASGAVRVIGRTPLGNRKHLLIIEAYDEILMFLESEQNSTFVQKVEDERILGQIRFYDRRVHGNFSGYLRRAMGTSATGIAEMVRQRAQSVRTEDFQRSSRGEADRES